MLKWSPENCNIRFHLTEIVACLEVMVASLRERAVGLNKVVLLPVVTSPHQKDVSVCVDMSVSCLDNIFVIH